MDNAVADWHQWDLPPYEQRNLTKKYVRIYNCLICYRDLPYPHANHEDCHSRPADKNVDEGFAEVDGYNDAFSTFLDDMRPWTHVVSSTTSPEAEPTRSPPSPPSSPEPQEVNEPRRDPDWSSDSDTSDDSSNDSSDDSSDASSSSGDDYESDTEEEQAEDNPIIFDLGLDIEDISDTDV